MGEEGEIWPKYDSGGGGGDGWICESRSPPLYPSKFN